MDPVTLTITTLPPTLPVFAVVGEVLDELPPQAVARTQAAASGPS